ncbi:MAG: hypothetical protein JEY96_19365 [Bacteroidales bacterium]|nr:hypothetical protein [Bacteroidales bacterium]
METRTTGMFKSLGTSIMEKASIDKLEDFAKGKGIKYYTNSSLKNYSLVKNERYSSSKFVVFELQNLFLIFYDSYTPKAFTSSTYCGLFKKMPECKNEMKISKRYWLDNLSFRKRLKSGDSYIDNKVTIFSENNEIDRFILNSSTIRKYIEITKRIMPLEIVTIKNSMSVVSELNGNNLIALKSIDWILDTKELELFIEKGSELLNSIN